MSGSQNWGAGNFSQQNLGNIQPSGLGGALPRLPLAMPQMSQMSQPTPNIGAAMMQASPQQNLAMFGQVAQQPNGWANYMQALSRAVQLPQPTALQAAPWQPITPQVGAPSGVANLGQIQPPAAPVAAGPSPSTVGVPGIDPAAGALGLPIWMGGGSGESGGAGGEVGGAGESGGGGAGP